jgi:hypothetical protein
MSLSMQICKLPRHNHGLSRNNPQLDQDDKTTVLDFSGRESPQAKYQKSRTTSTARPQACPPRAAYLPKKAPVRIGTALLLTSTFFARRCLCRSGAGRWTQILISQSKSHNAPFSSVFQKIKYLWNASKFNLARSDFNRLRRLKTASFLEQVFLFNIPREADLRISNS